MRTDLVTDALTAAHGTRGSLAGAIFHSDHGAQYSAKTFAGLCARLGVTQSMGRVGSALDNAMAEALNSTLKVEYVHRQRFATRAEARTKIVTWITEFYNPRRRHSACGWQSPIEFEHGTATPAEAA
jgi:putative transposase